MIFSSFVFVLIFLPIVFGTYSTLLALGKVRLAKWSLVLASLWFYAYGSGDFFPFFVGSVAFNYAVGRLLSEHRNTRTTRRRLLFGFGIIGNVGLLGYYKYTDFVLFNFNALFGEDIPYKNIVLPIGISFFTFQLIAYLVDSYRGLTRDYELLNYLLFITFFPQLIVGPIVHHAEVVPQYDALRPALPKLERLAKGLFLFSIGCAKKLLLADPLSEWAQAGFDRALSLNMVESWASSLGYVVSYYYDLSGYADMAIGLGLMFGITIPINFNSPYKARNFADYWKRWHITLSRFLGSYVFRSVYDKTKGSANFYLALFITFLVSGFWHGAGWTFVVWGVLNGLFVMASHMMIRAGKSLPHPLAWALTFAGVVGTRILFVSGSFDDAMHVLAQLFDFSSFALSGNANMATKMPAYITVGLFIAFFLQNSNELASRFRPNFRYACATAVLIVLSALNMSTVRGFLYFQF
jgi:D-alanyl-lipoteichoic acid acyltransferase DltB (MBOAT superfamily)